MLSTTPKIDPPGAVERHSDKPSILVVDDDDAIRELLADVLSSRGYTVVEAINGKYALQQVRHNPVDLVITDLVMPEQEGLETILQFQQEFPGLKVIAISGYQAGEFLRHASVFGACATIKKPFSIDFFMQVVAQTLVDAGRPAAEV